ncbi:protein O-linked-mannose beta-1,2-N-acetylglucosaminyltransferase 1-like isoform X2 [Apostichopus japonicus]|uniref:protein O-linked-mannose beta-1,2-N-acetylglucosaminyltransferase 1-like isoform X2 n=1 Tax=Stichopus japonicus TaxID=307972 RepID=UPI003AB206E3
MNHLESFHVEEDIKQSLPMEKQLIQFWKRYHLLSFWALISYVSACILVLLLTQHSEVEEFALIDDVEEYLRRVIQRGEMFHCGMPVRCQAGQFSFSLSSGERQDIKPTMCYNGSYQVFLSREMGRGLNLLLIDDKLKIPRHERLFDLYGEGDENFLRYLKNVQTGHIIFIVTFDDASYRMSDETKHYLKDHFGSREIINLNYRGSWVFVGQKGGRHAKEFEAVAQRADEGSWADSVSIKGCLSFPYLENVSPVKNTNSAMCGMKLPCSGNETAVKIVSASLENTALLPVSFCVNGKEKFANIGGRGLNFLVYDLDWGSVIRSQSFDTYVSEAESDRLVEFLREVNERQLLIGAVSDDASRWLSVHAKDILERFGAIKIHDLTFKGMWVFVGMKGIQGSSPFEEMNLASNVNDKSKAKVALNACIPDKIEGFRVLHPSEVRRREFCKKYPSYVDLCSGERKKDLRALPLDDMSLHKNKAYSTPILVIGGADLKALQRCMDSLLEIPGLNRDNVYVVLEGHFEEPSDLVKLYGFRVKEQPSFPSYHENLRRALELSLTFQKDKPYVIVLEPYLEVSPDFLRYFSQTLHLLEQDRSLLTVSAWNENGFIHSSGAAQIFYRTQNFPGFGWVLSRPLMDEIRDTKYECCQEPTWRGWFQGEFLKGREIIVPDLSRVRRSLPTGFTMETPFLRRYLKDRISSINSNLEPTETYKLTYHEYETEIKSLIASSRLLNTTVLHQCLQDGTRLATSLSLGSSAIYSVYFHQSSAIDDSVVRKLASCFGLSNEEEVPFRNWHESVVRFTRYKSQFILVGSYSKFFLNKPINTVIVT